MVVVGLLGAILTMLACASETKTHSPEVSTPSGGQGQGQPMSTANKPVASANPTATNTGTGEPTGPKVGGWQPSTPDEQAAYTAVQAVLSDIRAKAGDNGLSIQKIVSVQSQVVAGKNYKVELEVLMGGATKRIKVTVFRDLKGNHQLTDYQGP